MLRKSGFKTASALLLALCLFAFLPASAEAGKAPDVLISELMVKNKVTVTDADGDFSDYIELYNPGSSAVSMQSWTLSDGAAEWVMPDVVIEGGQRLIVFASGKNRTSGELHANFKLGGGETLSLTSPDKRYRDSVRCPALAADIAYIRSDEGFTESSYASPGYADYRQWQENSVPAGPLVINEVMTSNLTKKYEELTDTCDWVEIRNISDEIVELSDYYLSDDSKSLRQWRFPEGQLAPGKTTLVICDPEGYGMNMHTDFKLSDTTERLYLSDENSIIDCTLLRDIKSGGSFGRMEGLNGYFFFEQATPLLENYGGERLISEKPSSSTEPGVYNNIKSIEVKLSGEGTVYYTTDGSLPNEYSEVYTGTIKVDKTCVIRACAKQDGCLMSRALTLSFIVNEDHSLPVLSLAADNPGSLRYILMSGGKGREVPGELSYFGPDGSFTIGCGASISGHDSRSLPKKSIKVDFRGVYGQEMLDYALFDNSDVTEYSSLSIRSGQDNHRAIFRQEIWQDLAAAMTDSVLTQHSKFCILYVNGEYYGIVCLKENISSQYYASAKGVSKSSVDDCSVPDNMHEDFYEDVLLFCCSNDLSDPENYAELCSRLDIDSFIDWVILEGCCANTDLYINYRFFRSSELGGKWQAVLFDLDHGMIDDFSNGFAYPYYTTPELFAFSGLLGFSYFGSDKITNILTALLENEQFRTALLSRFDEVYDTYLSNESILERINYYSGLLEPEVQRDWERWAVRPELWDEYVSQLRDLVTLTDWSEFCKSCLLYYISASPVEP